MDMILINEDQLPNLTPMEELPNRKPPNQQIRMEQVTEMMFRRELERERRGRREMESRLHNVAKPVSNLANNVDTVTSNEIMKNEELYEWLTLCFPTGVTIESNNSSSDDNYTMFGKSKGDITIFELSNGNIRAASILASQVEEEVGSAIECKMSINNESQMIANMFISAANIVKRNVELGKFCDIVRLCMECILYTSITRPLFTR